MARELERRWEDALAMKRNASEEYDRFLREQPEQLTATQREVILHLSDDVSQIWHATTTTGQDRKEIVRLLLDRVVVDVQGDSELVDVALHWAGGFVSFHRLRRPIASYEQLSNYRELCDRIDSLRENGKSFAKIAKHLNREGFYPPKLTSRFTGEMVGRLLGPRGLHGRRPKAMDEPDVLDEYEYWLTDLSRELGISFRILLRWKHAGWVHGRKIPIAGGRWALWADDEELRRLRKLWSYRRQRPVPCVPVELTKPKPRDTNT